MKPLSVVIPVYNAESSIRNLVFEVKKVLHDFDLEIILINDGSRDNSESICIQLAQENHEVIFIALRKNFGEHNAVLCGLNHVTKQYAVIIDDDFQNPPSEILKLYAEIEKGYDVVYSQYLSKKHSFFRNLGSSINDSIATLLLKKPKKLYLSSFKIITKDLIDEIIQYAGPFPYIDGLIMRLTNNIGTVVVEHQHRLQGRSNYTISKLISLYLNMFLNFSIKPLRVFTLFGVLLFILGIVFSIAFIIEKILYPDISAGWTSLMIAILTLSGFQIIFLGLIGEYLGKQYLDQNKTPQWSIKKLYKNGQIIEKNKT